MYKRLLKFQNMERKKIINVPFNDLNRIHDDIQKKIIKDFDNLVSESRFILNKEIEDFEKDFSNFTNSKYTITCANGTDAIELILRSLDIGFGDEVIIPVNTFIATATAVIRAGATPVFVDNDEFYLINIEKIEEKITKKTKAIIAVNLYGQLSDLAAINSIAKKYSIYLIEDSAQSHGATNSKLNKNLSIASAYSFYPGKNLGGWGDGGAVTTNNRKIFESIKLMRNVGSEKKYEHKTAGFNSRLQPLQGLVLKEKLRYLNQWNKERNKISKKYFEGLNILNSISLPKTRKDNYHVWHLYVIRVKNRKKILEDTSKHGVEFGLHYPMPIHRQKAFKTHPQYRSKFNNADTFSNQLLSLPIFPKMKDREIERVIEVVSEYAVS